MDKFDWVIEQAREAELQEDAKKPLFQYQSGMLTVQELCEALARIIEAEEHGRIGD